MSFPVTLGATLTVPPDEGLPPTDIPFLMTATVTQRSLQELVLVGSGSQVVNLGTITALKAVVIYVAPGTGAAAVKATWNTGDAGGAAEISPGGFMAVGSPSPTAGGLSALTLDYTVDSTVKLWLYG